MPPGAPVQRSRLSAQRRLWRVLHILVHLCRGLYVMRVRFPHMGAEARRGAIQRWSARLLNIIGVHLRIKGSAGPFPGAMLVMNHISWLDVYAILAIAPVRFVAKAEIRSWPLVGRLVEGAGTLFIERGRKSHARRTNDRIADALRSGDAIAVYPEGTTSEGDVLLPFHAALFQPAADAGASIQPLALRYLDRAGAATKVAAYVRDITLIRSLWRIVGERSLTVEIDFMPGVATAGKDRRELARECELAIASALCVAAPQRKSLRTAFDPLAEPR